MRHGYTNGTTRVGALVTKSFTGPRAAERQGAEERALGALAGRFPVPAVRASVPGILTLDFVDGRHGQELIDEGRADSVLAACGRTLRMLHALDPGLLASTESVDGDVIVHGDFGPNNVLLTPDGGAVTAVLDWEFSRVGSAIDDLAWCEWIVRAHHPDAVGALPAFFAAYGETPEWTARQDAMRRRCGELEALCRESDPDGPGVRLWRRRADDVAGWTDQPVGADDASS